MARIRRSPDVIHESIDGRSTLIDPSGAELITLNPVGSLVWETLDGPTDHEELARHVANRFPDEDAAQIATDVSEFIDELVGLGLVVVVDG